MENNSHTQTESTNSTCYYVATNGNNNNTGLSMDLAWKTPGYAVGQVKAGDTIYLADGTYENVNIKFETTGTAEKPIKLKAYSGTPTLDGVDNSGTCILIDSEYSHESDNYTNVIGYINIEGIKITRYAQGIYIKGAHHISLDNIDVGPCKTTCVTFFDCQYCDLKNSDIHDTKWNTVQLMTAWIWTHHITIDNCTIHGSPGTWGGSESHGLIDLFNVNNKDNHNLTDIKIVNNEIYDATMPAFFTHGMDNLHMYRINLSNNIIHDSYGVAVSHLEDSIVANNTLYNQYPWGFYTCTPNDIQNNVTFIGNNVSVKPGGIEYWLIPAPNAEVLITNDKSEYFRINTRTVTIRDNERSSFTIETAYNGKIILQFTDSREFTENGKGTIEYHSDYSEYITKGDEKVRITTEI